MGAQSHGELHPVIGLWPVALAGDLEQQLGTGVRKVLHWTDRHGTVAVPFLMSQNGREATTARAGRAGEDSGSRLSAAATAPASTTASQARPATHPPPHSPFIARRRRGRPALARSGAGPAPARSGSPGTAPGGGTRAGPPGCRVWLRTVLAPAVTC